MQIDSETFIFFNRQNYIADVSLSIASLAIWMWSDMMTIDIG